MTYNEQETIRNDLQQPEKTYNEQETTYNEQEMTWNDPQGAKYNLKRHKRTYNEVKKKRNDQQQADFEIILQHATIGSLLSYVFHPKLACNHSSIASWRIMVKTERKTIAYYHVYLLTGYKIYRIRCEPLWYSKINIYETKINLMNEPKKKFISLSHWKTTECWLYFAFQIELKGFKFVEINICS